MRHTLLTRHVLLLPHLVGRVDGEFHRAVKMRVEEAFESEQATPTLFKTSCAPRRAGGRFHSALKKMRLEPVRRARHAIIQREP